MRILFLSPRQCWPPVSGAKLREYHMARALGKRAELTYVFFNEPGVAVPGSSDLPFCKEIVAVPRPPLYSPGRIARGLLGRRPLPVVNYTSREMKNALAAVVRGAAFDLVHLDSIHMAGYESYLKRELPRARVVYNWHNIESELMRRFSLQEKSVPKKFYAAITAPRLAAAEKRILHSAFGHVVCSDRERAELLKIVPGARIEVIDNGVDTQYFTEDAAPVSGRSRIVFVGAMAYHANIDAAVWFTRQIWPRIRARFPDWRLTLVGSNPAPAVVALDQEPGVEVTGTVPDVRPYYGEALAAIVPLRSGGGTRLKILEAMAAGAPVISTSLGAEGLEVSPGKDILIVDDDEQWIAALASVSDRGAALAAAGRVLVESRYDWEVLGRRLYETYSTWVETQG
jgi:sugar transferase (PEP-CTERM/EpsH1 system associated)